MLTISGPIAAGRSAEYHREMAKGEYYTGDGQAPGRWFGNGTGALKLGGQVQPKMFERLLEGYSPDGQKALVQNAGDKHRQEGWDQTISAPKPVSVLWAFAPPELQAKIEAAHRHAVETALAYLESNAGLTRRGPSGRTKEKAALVYATFLETVSRDLDPQIHTHAVLLNLSVRLDGSTGALWSYEFFFQKMAAGAVYRAQLAADLRQDPGVRIAARRVGFDIEGVPGRMCRDLSKRRQAIEKELERKGDTSAIAAKVAAIDTRPKKQKVSREVLAARWQETARVHGWTQDRLHNVINQPRMGKASVQELAAALKAQAQRLPVAQRTRKNLVRVAGRLAIELNADGNVLRAVFEQHLPAIVQSAATQRQSNDRGRTRESAREMQTTPAGSPRPGDDAALQGQPAGRIESARPPNRDATHPGGEKTTRATTAIPTLPAAPERQPEPARPPEHAANSDPGMIAGVMARSDDPKHVANARPALTAQESNASTAPTERQSSQSPVAPVEAHPEEKETRRRVTTRSSVIHPGKADTRTIEELVRKYGTEQQERSRWAERFGSSNEHSSGVRTVHRIRKATTQQTESKVAPAKVIHTPQLERQLVKFAQEQGLLNRGASAQWSEAHSGLIVPSDKGSIVVRVRHAPPAKPSRTQSQKMPLKEARKRKLVELVKASGIVKNAQDAYWSDAASGVVVTTEKVSSVVRLKKTFNQQAANAKFERVFMKMAGRMHPDNQTRPRLERLAWWVARRTGADEQTLRAVSQRFVPESEQSFLHWEARQLFPRSPVSYLRELRVPVLRFGPQERQWGKILWKQEVLVGELRVQMMRLAPRAPRWSPLHGVAVPALHLTTKRSTLPPQRSLPSRDAEAKARRQTDQHTKPSDQRQHRRQTMEQGY